MELVKPAVVAHELFNVLSRVNDLRRKYDPHKLRDEIRALDIIARIENTETPGFKLQAAQEAKFRRAILAIIDPHAEL